MLLISLSWNISESLICCLVEPKTSWKLYCTSQWWYYWESSSDISSDSYHNFGVTAFALVRFFFPNNILLKMVEENFVFFIMKRAFVHRISVLYLSRTSFTSFYKEFSSFWLLRNKSKCRALSLHIECFWAVLLISVLASLYFITSGLLKQLHLLCLVHRKFSTALLFCNALSVGDRRVSFSCLPFVNLYYVYV